MNSTRILLIWILYCICTITTTILLYETWNELAILISGTLMGLVFVLVIALSGYKILK